MRTPAATALYEGKIALDAGQYQRAIEQLSAAAANLPLLADYALYWRAKAHFGANDTASALSDLQASRESRKGTPLSKSIRLLEIELEKKRSGENLGNLFRRYIADYPADFSAKYRYALFLKEQGKIDRARTLFHELFLTVSPAAEPAEAELDPADIAAEDLLAKARNLNSAWMFQDAEKRFRDAIEMKPSVRTSAYNGLAYALFRQKKYREAAELYEKTGNTYWHARSLLRSNQLQSFESEIDALLRSRESRTGSLLLSYASKKRREGDARSALLMYDKVASRYVSEKEEALWLTGWTHYRTKNFALAAELFGRLQASYGKLKYLYWKNRSLEQLHPETARKYPAGGAGDFYAFLSSVREAQPFAGVVPGDADSRKLNSERVEILLGLGFLQEASGEIQLIAAKASSNDTLLAASEQFRRVRNYKLSIQTAAKIPYRSAVHDLYFPVAYRAEVEEAARKTGLDAGLLLAVIREESLFDPDARSIAGALGLMQLMPQTAQRVAQSAGIPYRSADDIYRPRTNIMLGAAYLKSLIAEFGGIPYAIAAYNAGEEVVREWIRTGAYGAVDEFMEDIPYYETQNYTKKVLTSYFQYLRMRDETDIRAVQRQLGLL
ncbi:MAG TPA: lytic transglycosylase domain-containing protein [Dissulfurispiraceae bacterium]|nr:lytic transglycosylase domain-containing protein [Dissulfurispiraceae bacterium]